MPRITYLTPPAEPPVAKSKGTWGGARPGAGRPKSSLPPHDRQAFVEYARSFSHVAIDRLAKIVTGSKSETTAIQAAQVLLDRAWGKPHQTADLDATVRHQVPAEEPDPRRLAMAILCVLRDAAEEQRQRTPIVDEQHLSPVPRGAMNNVGVRH